MKEHKTLNYLLDNTIKSLKTEEKVVSGAYEFIGDSNITYADIHTLIEAIENNPYQKIVEELKQQPTLYRTKYLDRLGFVEDKFLNELIEELENKYLGVDKQ